MVKSFIRKIDDIFFGGIFVKAYKRFKKQDEIQTAVPDLTPMAVASAASQNSWDEFGNNFEYRFVVHYKKNNSSLLSGLCDKYGSDKGEIKKTDHLYPWPSHTYTDFYSRLFDHCRFDVKKVFECGLGTNNVNFESNMTLNGKPGASLRVWRDYFPNSQVVGVDIDKDVLFEEERIKTFQLDQTDPKAIGEFWNSVGLSDFDFMVDDGLHTYDAGVCLFENSISRLSEHGIYIIEDINKPILLKFKNYFENKMFQVDYVNLLPVLGFDDNNLVVIRKS